MTDAFSLRRPRRLPVFFLIDTSREMGGTFQVTLQEGLEVVKRLLLDSPIAARHVYLAGITFGEKTVAGRLRPVDAFEVAPWQAQGVCNLGSALVSLAEALTYDLLVTRPDRPGDYTPLVFPIIGDHPADAWEDALPGLATFSDNRHPLIVALVTRPELARDMRKLSNHVLLLSPAEAQSITSYFFWVAHVIATICADCERGATTVDFPAFPYGVVMPR